MALPATVPSLTHYLPSKFERYPVDKTYPLLVFVKNEAEFNYDKCYDGQRCNNNVRDLNPGEKDL